MRCSTPSPSGAVTVPQQLATNPATAALPPLHLVPSNGTVFSHNSSRAPAAGAVAQHRSRSLQRRCAGIWAEQVSVGSPSPAQRAKPSRCSKNGDGEVGHVEDVQRLSDEAMGKIGGEGRDGKGAVQGGFSSKELMEKLKRYGVAGVLSYGLLNTFYYLTTFLLVWFYFAPAPGKMGYAAAVERFVKVMVAVWAGSQVTKLFRAGGALALAPLVDKGLSWFTVKFKFQSKGKAFAAIAGACFGLAFLLFLVLTLLWA